MYYSHTSNFFHALSTLLLDTGAVSREELVTPESLDRALKAYIRKAMEEE